MKKFFDDHENTMHVQVLNHVVDSTDIARTSQRMRHNKNGILNRNHPKVSHILDTSSIFPLGNQYEQHLGVEKSFLWKHLQVVLLSIGHNDALLSSPDEFLTHLCSLVDNVYSRLPQASIFVMVRIPPLISSHFVVTLPVNTRN